MTYVSDRHRVEILLPPQMMLAVIIAGVEDHETVEFKRCRDALLKASADPIDDLPPKAQNKIINRVQRLHLETTKPYRMENAEVGKLGLIVFYVLKSIVDAGYLQYPEDGPLATGFAEFIGGVEPHAQEDLKDQSAQKQARKMLRELQAQGYYPGVPFHSEA